MATVKVYQYKRPYDMETDTEGLSQRMGTREFIERVKGTIMEASVLEVDESEVSGEGMTEIGFAKKLNVWTCEFCGQRVIVRADGSARLPTDFVEKCKLSDHIVGRECIAYRDLATAKRLLGGAR